MKLCPVFLACSSLLFISRIASAQSDTFTQGFENVPALTAAGWVFRNNSSTPVESWGQGNDNVFDAQSGIPTDYVGVGVGSTAGDAPGEVISNWLLTPTLTLSSQSVISFWTRTVDTPFAPDRLEVRLSTNGGSSGVGNRPTDVGDFVTTLLTINPDLTTVGYPNSWRQYSISLNNVSGTFTGRVGFRYYVEDGGVLGANSDYIGLDTLRVAPVAVPEQSVAVLALVGILATIGLHGGYGATRNTRPSRNPSVISPSP